QLGYIGPNSFAEETQRLIHKVFDYKTVFGWQHQIRNAAALQTGVLYSAKISADKKIAPADFHFQADVTAGTVFTGATVGILSRIALKPLLPVYESNLHGAALSRDKTEQSELYL